MALPRLSSLSPLKIIIPGPFEVTALPVIVMVVSAAVNYLVSGYLYKVAKEEDSIALEADALHLKNRRLYLNRSWLGIDFDFSYRGKDFGPYHSYCRCLTDC